MCCRRKTASVRNDRTIPFFIKNAISFSGSVRQRIRRNRTLFRIGFSLHCVLYNEQTSVRAPVGADAAKGPRGLEAGGRARGCENVNGRSSRADIFPLISRRDSHICGLPKFARACGRARRDEIGFIARLKATTVRAFLVSAGSPSAGVTEEAHLHCRDVRTGFPLQSLASIRPGMRVASPAD